MLVISTIVFLNSKCVRARSLITLRKKNDFLDSLPLPLLQSLYEKNYYCLNRTPTKLIFVVRTNFKAILSIIMDVMDIENRRLWLKSKKSVNSNFVLK